MRMGKLAAAVAVAAGPWLAAAADAAAQAPEVRFARQFSLCAFQEAMPSSWKDLFFPEIHALPGS